jgi:hypothetical protein
MSFINKIPRGLRVLVVMAISGILVWKLATGTDYFYYSIGAALLVTFGAIVLVYQPFKTANSGPKRAKKASKKDEAADDERGEEGIEDTLSMEDEKEKEMPAPPPLKSNYGKQPASTTPLSSAPRRSGTHQPDAMEVARNYRQSGLRNNEAEAASNRTAARPAGMAAGMSRPPTKSAPPAANPAKSSGGISGRSSTQPKATEGKMPVIEASRNSAGDSGKFNKFDKTQAKPIQTEDEDDLPPVEDVEHASQKTAVNTTSKSDGGGNFINKIQRGLRVIIVMAVLGVLIWRFAQDTPYFFYSIGAASLITFAVIVWIYKPFKFQKRAKTTRLDEHPELTEEVPGGMDQAADIAIESDYTDAPPAQRPKPVVPFRDAVHPAPKPQAALNRPLSPMQNKEVNPKPVGPAPKNAPLRKAEEDEPTDKVVKNIEGAAPETPAIPLVEDETILTEEDKNTLLNAVWYRCENPFCKYTSFLGVHHIVDEKEGGTNRLDNLIVLCPFCHDLAHRNEIPEEEMREWIGNRENRFKFKPDWKYY